MNSVSAQKCLSFETKRSFLALSVQEMHQRSSLLLEAPEKDTVIFPQFSSIWEIKFFRKIVIFCKQLGSQSWHTPFEKRQAML